MQPKKQPQNPEVPTFNIRKLNKKGLGHGKFQGQFPSYTPEFEQEKKIQTSNLSDSKKEKQHMLHINVNEAITNSKAYVDLKKNHMEIKKKNQEEKKELQQKIEASKKEKDEAVKQRQKLEAERQKYLQVVNALKEKIHAVRATNDRYKEALQNKMSGEAEYISNLLISMRFQAEYQHDINPDEMTYEQLLELEQKIGVVSKGVPLEYIETLPKVQVLESSEQKCSICFSNYQQGELMTKIPNCKHQFHTECLTSWLGKEKICPICKQEIIFNYNEEEN